MKNLIFIFFAAFCCILSENRAFCELAYCVEFTGDIDNESLSLLQDASQLISLQETPPITMSGLQRRIDTDIDNLIEQLHSRAYFSAQITAKIDKDACPVGISLDIVVGPQFPLERFEIQSNCSCGPTPSLEDLGIQIGEPAFPKTILDAEDELLEQWQEAGYPFVRVEKRDVLVDLTAEVVRVNLYIDSGPLAVFGQTYITGNKTVKLGFFSKKIAWCPGETFTSCRIAETKRSLDATRLFREVTINHAEELDEDGSLPMTITVDEGKHRSIGFGLSYATSLGPGVMAEWEHRNFRGVGETVTFTADLWWSLQQMRLLYLKPDFYCPRQNLYWLAELEHEKTKGFTESYFAVSGTLERQITDNAQITYGGMYKALESQHSDNNGDFNLLKAPLGFNWINTDDLLNPTTGQTLHIKVVPTAQIFNNPFTYVINTATGTAYFPMDAEHRQILAIRGIFGSILGAPRHEIPPPERFYAGSDTTLRGYHYLTVSPLGEHHKPIGGRSMMIFTVEPRFRFGKNLGAVLFYDIGNVYRDTLPSLSHKQLQSVGTGFRYHTPIGPLRFDIAFPLNRRKHLDGPFQVYFSVGQSF